MTEFWDKRAKQLLVLSGALLFLYASVKFAKYFSEIFAIIGISILIAYLLIGPVDFLTRIVKYRTIAVMLVYLFIIIFFVMVSIFIGPKVAAEFGEFTQKIPEITNSLNKNLQDVQVYLNKSNIPINIPSIRTGILNKIGIKTMDTLTNILSVASSTIHVVFYILVTAVISYYFLLEGHKITHGLAMYIPQKYHVHLHNLISELDKCLRGFYGGMVKLAAINATVMFTTYLIMKVPYSLLLALWHFLSCIIPVVGGWFGLIPALIVIAFTDPLKVWIPLVVYEGFTRLVKDNFITPRIMGDAIGMHPVLVLIAVLAGLKTAGLVGILFALPLFGTINVIFKYSLKQIPTQQE